jgi:hypothetical protein
VAGARWGGRRLTLPQYIALVDWTGRQWRAGKASIEASTPALATLGIAGVDWLKQVRGVGSGYRRAVARAEALVARAKAIGQSWLRGVSFARGIGLARPRLPLVRSTTGHTQT